mmetsp:Transcript_4595/g.12789  ORF Transcript_4595/g.12789 Transcript_4595/m.12789 type:complete len:354 (-) Transcript_4595:1024-2085(-)
MTVREPEEQEDALAITRNVNGSSAGLSLFSMLRGPLMGSAASWSGFHSSNTTLPPQDKDNIDKDDNDRDDMKDDDDDDSFHSSCSFQSLPSMAGSSTTTLATTTTTTTTTLAATTMTTTIATTITNPLRKQVSWLDEQSEHDLCQYHTLAGSDSMLKRTYNFYNDDANTNNNYGDLSNSQLTFHNNNNTTNNAMDYSSHPPKDDPPPYYYCHDEKAYVDMGPLQPSAFYAVSRCYPVYVKFALLYVMRHVLMLFDASSCVACLAKTTSPKSGFCSISSHDCKFPSTAIVIGNHSVGRVTIEVVKSMLSRRLLDTLLTSEIAWNWDLQSQKSLPHDKLADRSEGDATILFVMMA